MGGAQTFPVLVARVTRQLGDPAGVFYAVPPPSTASTAPVT